MKLYRLIGFALVAALLRSAPQRGQSRIAEFRVITTGPDRRPVRPTRADLYLDVWGGGKLIPMSREDRGATVRIDRASLCLAWPEGCPAIFSEPERVVLQANGLAPVTRSVEFADGSGSFEMTVSFRRPVNRSIQIMDDSGAAVSGANVRGQILFAETNHCGFPEGELLFQSVTDQSGRVRVPDVDGDIYIELGVSHAVLKKAGPFSPTSLTVSADSFPATLVLHRFERRALQLVFTNDGKPATGLKLRGILANPGCSVVLETLAETDATGQIQIDDFYPEEYESLELLDPSGKLIWKSVAPFNPPGRRATITLP